MYLNSNEEQVAKDLHLRKIALGKIDGKMTGYASVDKPWLKYYDEETLKKEFVPMSIYQLMKKQNLGHEKEIALSYFGKQITYGQLLENIDIVATALLEAGVKKDEIVMMSMPNTPEAEYIFYAINKIGAVVNSIDPRTSEDVIRKSVIESKAKLFFAVDVILEKILRSVKDTDINKIIPVSPHESLPMVLKVLTKVKKKSNNHNKHMTDTMICSWNLFLEKGKKSALKAEEIFEKEKMAVIIYTGGSTGVPKGVMLSNENFNALAYQLIYTNMGFKRGKVYLNILPPFIALGLNNAMHVSACAGLKSILIPTFEPEDFPKLIKKHRPNFVMGGPIHWNMLINSKIMNNVDLSYLEICVSGGDKMPRNIQEKVQDFLKNHNAKADIWIGYGATECSSGISCVKGDCFRWESVGCPYLKNVVEVFDVETNEKINGYGNIGELRINAPTMMLGYFGDMNQETDKVIMTDSDGVKWYCTGDLAHFDSDGMLYIDGRIKRIITRRGFKIYPVQIEQLILRHPAVKECAVVGVEDPDELAIPVANIVLDAQHRNDDMEKEVIRFIEDAIKKELPEYSVLAGYNFHDELPVTPIGKLDFKKLESVGILNKEKHMQETFELM